MCDCGLDYPEFSQVSEPKARKIHQCDECYQCIFPGQKYFKNAVKYEGEFYTLDTPTT